ncbi:MAG: hypothetical protein CBE00_05595 [Planctomycetaceae bacterium TMED240]|nr:hypothetical protein [Rhodopirellula sp.]OUX07219.1 MAG: hypothetical protein CBE00_05595 [Planctomycetaceae bacterium TMED240]
MTDAAANQPHFQTNEPSTLAVVSDPTSGPACSLNRFFTPKWHDRTDFACWQQFTGGISDTTPSPPPASTAQARYTALHASPARL